MLIVAIFAAPCANAYAEAADKDPKATGSVSVPADEKDLLELILQVKEFAAKTHPSNVATKTLYEGMLRGLLGSFGDPHSKYMTEGELVALTNSLDGTYSGVGVVLQLVDGKVTVVSLVKKSPAEAAGVKPGDVVTSVDGKESASLDDAAVAIRGPVGTSVILIVNRPSTGETICFGLCRELISSSAVEAQDIGDGLYYIDVNQFDISTGASFASEIAKVKSRGAKGLLLDLRDNPGGLLDVGVKIAENLVPNGPVLELQGKGERRVIYGKADTLPIPVVVLVNGRSASASEIVAGAIKDYGVGILVGEKTYGKGSIQQVIPLGNGLGAIRITIANYFTPSGTSISGNGLVPDIPAENRPALPGKIELKRTLRMGTVGLDVLRLQENLAFLGYYGGDLDGVFGPATGAAIERFLADRGLGYSGSLDAAAAKTLEEAALAKSTNSPDAVYAKGLEALRTKTRTGAWPVPAK